MSDETSGDERSRGAGQSGRISAGRACDSLVSSSPSLPLSLHPSRALHFPLVAPLTRLIAISTGAADTDRSGRMRPHSLAVCVSGVAMGGCRVGTATRLIRSVRDAQSPAPCNSLRCAWTSWSQTDETNRKRKKKKKKAARVSASETAQSVGKNDPSSITCLRSSRCRRVRMNFPTRRHWHRHCMGFAITRCLPEGTKKRMKRARGGERVRGKGEEK